MILKQISLRLETNQTYQMGIPSSTIAAAKAKLLQFLQDKHPNLTPDQLILTSFKAVTWKDTSLGCPIEGECYAQALTPGYQLAFQLENEHFLVHTDADGTLTAIPDFKVF